MIWLILGTIGITLFFVGIFLIPVWVGAATYKEALMCAVLSFAVVGVLFLISWSFAHGYNQVFPEGTN